MPTPRPFRAIVLFVATVLLAGAPAAVAQVDLPPRVDELSPPRPWTYVFGRAILVGAVLLLIALAVGYLLKAREFRTNLRRGGSK